MGSSWHILHSTVYVTSHGVVEKRRAAQAHTLAPHCPVRSEEFQILIRVNKEVREYQRLPVSIQGELFMPDTSQPSDDNVKTTAHASRAHPVNEHQHPYNREFHSSPTPHFLCELTTCNHTWRNRYTSLLQWLHQLAACREWPTMPSVTARLLAFPTCW